MSSRYLDDSQVARNPNPIGEVIFHWHQISTFCGNTAKKYPGKSEAVVFCKKDVLENFTKFTGKDLCQSLFCNKVAGLSCRNH